MSEPDPNHEIVVARLMRQLDEFTKTLGLKEATTRRIVARVVEDRPDASEDDLLAEARDWLVIAAQ